MTAVTMGARIEGYQIAAYSGIVHGATFDDRLTNAEALGANAVLNTCYDSALAVDILVHRLRLRNRADTEDCLLLAAEGHLVGLNPNPSRLFETHEGSLGGLIR